MATRQIPRTTLGEGASHEGFLRHKRFRWAKLALLLCAAAVAGYALIDAPPRHYGGTAFGYVLGTVATLLILWLTLLGLRKRAMTPGRWSLKGWTSAHVWLGLSLTVLATLHSGLRFGPDVHTLAWGLMMAVILSGLYGIAVYAALPPALGDSRAEMTRPQMVDALAKLDVQLEAAAQPLALADAAVVRKALAEDPFAAGLLRRLSGSDARSATRRAIVALAPAGDAALLAVLERKVAALGQIRRHLRIRALLEVWLYVHVPLTFALLAALAAHILSVFFYW
ncbi:MAG: hypothetical protein JO013_13170 [Alphaproteobacteria bacterium]|nr:hypothetical protein [Alphaproteobacteria bacterium]